MKHTRDEKLNYLFDEIGGVDERMLTEALEYRAQKKQGNFLRTLTAIACALFLTVTSVSVVMVNWKHWFVAENAGGDASDGADLPNDAPNQPNPPVDVPNSPSEAPDVPSWSTHTLDALLQSAKEDANCTLLSSREEIAYFGGAYLLWQYAEDDVVYRSRALSTRELTRLRSMINDGSAVGDSAPTQLVRVWLTLGNGDVLTPYLPATPGNTSIVIFDYEAELNPSDELMSCISDILKP